MTTANELADELIQIARYPNVRINATDPAIQKEAAAMLRSQAAEIFALNGEVANKADYAKSMYLMHEEAKAELEQERAKHVESKDTYHALRAELEAIKGQEPVNQNLLSALKAALDWIDAVPDDVVLPAMPGFDRDDVDTLIATAEQAPQPAELSDAEINRIVCEHLEPEADDMHQLVRFARAVLLAQGAKT